MFGCTKWGPRLDVDIQTSRERQYNLPRIIFSANSLTTFTLVNCKLEQPSDTLSLYVLKRLTLVIKLNEFVKEAHIVLHSTDMSQTLTILDHFSIHQVKLEGVDELLRCS